MLLNYSFESHTAQNMVTLNTWSWLFAWSRLPKFIKLIFLLNDPKYCYFLYSRFQSLLLIFKSLLDVRQETLVYKSGVLVLQDKGLPGLCHVVRASCESSPSGQAGTEIRVTQLIVAFQFHKIGKSSFFKSERLTSSYQICFWSKTN